MEIIVVLIAGIVLAFPVMSIVALIKSSRTRKQLEDLSAEHRNNISGLMGEVAKLRREMTEISLYAHRGEPVPAVAERASEPQEPRKAPEPPATMAVAKAELLQPPPVAPFQHAPKPEVAAPPVTSPPHAVMSREPAAPGPAIARPVAPAAQIAPAAATPRSEAAPPIAPREERLPKSPQPDDPIPPPPNREPRKSVTDMLRAVVPLEEVLGMNVFAKVGIVLVVLGVALLGRLAFTSMGPGARVAMTYTIAAAMLGSGIFLETRERYRLVGRAGIGGGWALLFFTTYALHHVAAMTVLSSNTLDCVLMLIVAGAMVPHTLRYRSQVVTGLAFLLAFWTVALSQDSVYALSAGVILALAIVGIALRMGWYELEVFGILASYSNHFYWLYKLFPDGVAGHPFPQFWPSTVILILYWVVFRVSYVTRRIRAPRDEVTSTIAALVNTLLLGVVMKFQSTRPELAFYGMLALGAAEFSFGQLPVTRRRRPAFIVLTVMGTLIMFAAVPFKFGGNNIALFWMIAAEVLLIAGISQLEVVFRRLGLLAGVATGALIVWEAKGIFDLRMHSEAPLMQDGILLLTCCVLFCVNSLFIGRKWRELFQSIDEPLVISQGYIGCVTAFLGAWSIFTSDSTAVGWAALMVAAALGVRYLKNRHLIVQATALFMAVLIRAVAFNFHFSDLYPHHIAARLVTLPMLAAASYATAWALSGVKDMRMALRTLSLWAGSGMLIALAWLELPNDWIALTWMAFAVALALIARRIDVSDLAYQEHVLAAMVAAQLVTVTIDSHSAGERYLSFIGCAAALYAISRYCTLKNAPYRRPAAWIHTWGATALLATLAWNEASQPWLAAIWALFALALAAIDRAFEVEELPYQAHVLALLAVLRAVSLNFYTEETWHNLDLRLITVSILIAVFYALARWVRMPAAMRDAQARHAYTWVASCLTAWLLWCELQPISVAVGLAVLGLLLFEIGSWTKQKQLRLQAYAALSAAFGRIFFVNLTAATLPGETISPRIYTVAPIALIFFYVWARLQKDKAESGLAASPANDLIAYFGTGSLAALLYFQMSTDWIVVSWAALALVLMAAALLLKKEVFQQQASILAVAVSVRGLAHNIFDGSYFAEGGWSGSVTVLFLTAALLCGALPIAFMLRKRYAQEPPASLLSRITAARYAEQLFFFAPVALVTFTIAIKIHPGMITWSWGLEGLLLVLLGLLVSQRSYRITGLLLLLLCVGKIALHDALRLNDWDRNITFIALGAALFLVSVLYGKFRETVRKLL
jgi:uncharacterized membrane protein